MNEETHLLVGSGSSQKASRSNDDNNQGSHLKLIGSFVGGVLLATCAFGLLGENHSGLDLQATTASLRDSYSYDYSYKSPEHYSHSHTHEKHSSTSDHHHHYDSYKKIPKMDVDNEALTSKYTQFQALGFQIYTGGAPVELPGQPGVKNPECYGLNSYGQASELDPDDISRNITNTLWQCYLGHHNPVRDVNQRLDVMKDAVEKAEAVADKDPNTLKIFIAPEFFWRGKDGAYTFYNNASDPERFKRDKHFRQEDGHDFDPDCHEVCHVLKGLEDLVAHRKYENWLFLFGTVIVSENLPQEDKFDYVFYNFAPMMKGYDPDKTDHYGKRFLIPKRYLSQIDFLTPARFFNESLTKEMIQGEYQESQMTPEDAANAAAAAVPVPEAINSHSKPMKTKSKDVMDPHLQSTVVHNPFYEAPQRFFYNQDVWHDYKDELTSLGYTMIEYDWVIIDNITMTTEICVDHQAQVAINAYLADNVLGNPIHIPKTTETYDHHSKRTLGDVQYVRIPRHQAQLSLVSSSGMTINPNSLALADNGTILLQDGQTNAEGAMAWISECDWFSWHFTGGTQHVSRSAKLTNTDISFHYRLHHGWKQYGIWDDLDDPSDNAWKTQIKGVFTTARYEPKITVYSPQDVAKVG